MVRTRLGGAVVGLALLAGACNGSTSADPSPSPSPTVATSPSPSPTPAPSPSPTEVLPANDVDDPVAALEAIVRYRDHLFEHPDPDKLKLIYAERCECYEEVFSALTDAVAEGVRLRYDRPRTVEVLEIVDSHGPFAQVRYRQDAPGASLIEGDGDSVDRLDGSDEMVEGNAFLVREGGRWVVVALT